MTTVLINLAAVLGAIGVIFGFFYKPFKKLNQLISDEKEYRQSIAKNYDILNEDLDVKHKETLEIIDDIQKNIKENKLATLRIELNQMMDVDPKNADTIFELFEEYKKIGGNKYMDAKFNKWKKENGFGD